MGRMQAYLTSEGDKPAIQRAIESAKKYSVLDKKDRSPLQKFNTS